jgi:hypothetical protein
MTHSLFQLETHLASLLANHQYYLRVGDWERVDYLGLCIDDTHAQIEKVKTAKELAEASGDDGDNDEGDYHPYGDPQV